MKKLGQFEKRIICLYLNAREKIKTICLLSKQWNKKVYSGFAWDVLFDSEHDKCWRPSKFTTFLLGKFSQFSHQKHIYINQEICDIIVLVNHAQQISKLRLSENMSKNTALQILQFPFLSQKCIEIPQNITRFHIAAYQNNIESLHNLTAEFTLHEEQFPLLNVVLQDKEGQTPLHYAARSNSIDAALFLITNGQNIDQSNNQDETPLTIAIQNEYLEMINILCQCGCDLNRKNKNFNSPFLNYPPLHRAIVKGNNQIVKILLSSGANIHDTVDDKIYPIHLAIPRKKTFQEPSPNLKNSAEIIKTLLKFKADINSLNYKKDTPLHIAVWRGYFQLVKIFLQQNANLEISNELGNTPLHYVISSGEDNIKIAKLLIDYGANINAQNFSNLTPLDYATAGGHVLCFNLLLNIGATSAPKSDKTTLLHLAVKSGNEHIFEVVLNNFVKDINKTDDQQNTPLHYACKYKNKFMILKLVEMKAMTGIINLKKETPLSLVEKDEGLRKLLKK